MRSLALGFVIVLSAFTNVTAVQREGLLQRLVGVWHLTSIDNPYYEEHHLYTLELELTLSKFRTYYRVDLDDPSMCEGTVELDAEGELSFDTEDEDYCDALDSDVFDYSFRPTLRGRSLEMHETGTLPDDTPSVFRFERGRVQRLGVPPRPPCVDGARPPESRQQGPSFFAFERRFEWPNELVLSPLQRRAIEDVRRRRLRRAVDAFEGRADPVLLKFDYPTRHGDLIETFLDIRRGSADLTNRKEYGFQHFEWIRCPVSQMVVVEPVNSMMLVPIRAHRSTERARLLLRLDAEQSEALGVFPE